MSNEETNRRKRPAPAKQDNAGVLAAKLPESLQGVWSWIYRLRGVILGLPVAVCAIIQAVQNMSQLPELVGIGLQASGTYAVVLSRPVAALAPLTVTVLCLLLMLCSRRVFYPWVVSLFSLILPAVILYSNILLA